MSCRIVPRAAIAIIFFLMVALLPGPADAHATEQPFVLLLPTRLYMATGIIAVILTLLLVAIPRVGELTRHWEGRPVGRLRRRDGLATATSVASFLILLGLLACGWWGSADPGANPLPLALWTLWWIVLLMAQALLGDLWRWVNPWTGPYRMLRRQRGAAPLLRLPSWLGVAPGFVTFVMFAIFLTADVAPSDPRRLAVIVSCYWLFAFAGMWCFGAPAWLRQGEFVTMLMRRFAALAPLACRGRQIRLGIPGWRVLWQRASAGTGLFVIALLGVGSFESLYKTFWWLSLIGVNPLEFPGRSAVIAETVLGLLASIVLAAAIFAAVVAAGLRAAGEGQRFAEAFRRQAQCLLPIVFGYHVAHYLTSLLVDGQYLYAALSDPFATGADLLGIGHFHVTTGFLQTWDGARTIWLLQAGAVVIGHILAILLSHAVALDMLRTHRKAGISQLPISAFMVLYTFFGLWLLASPRGM